MKMPSRDALYFGSIFLLMSGLWAAGTYVFVHFSEKAGDKKYPAHAQGVVIHLGEERRPTGMLRNGAKYGRHTPGPSLGTRPTDTIG